MLAIVAVSGAVLAAGGSAQDGSRTTERAGPPAGTSVEALRRTADGWRACAEGETDLRPPSGGCAFEVAGDGRFRVATPFGDMALASCRLDFELRIGPSGFVAMGELGRSGPSPCGDIRSCNKQVDLEPSPWLGRIETDGHGGMRTVLDACLDTCVGWFEGPLTLKLERTATGWRLRADESMIGKTGLHIRGEWWLDGPSLRLVPEKD